MQDAERDFSEDSARSPLFKTKLRNKGGWDRKEEPNGLRDKGESEMK